MKKEYKLDSDILSQLGRIDLTAQFILEGVQNGLNRSKKTGFSSEFSDFKSYSRGDDIRFVDWKLYARTDKLFIRRFEDETDLDVTVMVDASKSMAWQWQGAVSKLQFSLNLAAAFALLHYRQHDRFGLIASSGDKDLYISPKRSQNHLEHIYSEMENLIPASGFTLPRLMNEFAAQQKKRGRIIILSDLLEDEKTVKKILQDLSGFGSEIVLFHIYDIAEIELPFKGKVTHLKDAETGELLAIDMKHLQKNHRKDVERIRENWRNICSKNGIAYFPITTTSDYVQVILDFLANEELK